MYKIRILKYYLESEHHYSYVEIEYSETLKHLLEKTCLLESANTCASYQVFQSHILYGWIPVAPTLIPKRSKWRFTEENFLTQSKDEQ